MINAQELVHEAREVAAGAYAPYSGIRVGAVAVAKDGTRYRGANVENAAYPSTLCAEAVAIGHAVSSGARELEAVAAACLDLEECYPCGQCRQRMAEFGVRTVIVQGPDGEARIHTLEELLPHGFTISGD
ncbi:MAG: cytidine deaminase [Acidimicrobiia bacterium]